MQPLLETDVRVTAATYRDSVAVLVADAWPLQRPHSGSGGTSDGREWLLLLTTKESIEMKFLIAAAAALIMTGPAFAQSAEHQPHGSSKVNQGTASTAASPKTTGAMNDATRSLATSAQDVAAQQRGDKTASDGGGHVEGAAALSEKRQSPKTTGAAPGAQ